MENNIDIAENSAQNENPKHLERFLNIILNTALFLETPYIIMGVMMYFPFLFWPLLLLEPIWGIMWKIFAAWAWPVFGLFVIWRPLTVIIPAIIYIIPVVCLIRSKKLTDEIVAKTIYHTIASICIFIVYHEAVLAV